MASEVDGKDSPVFKIITSIENELAINTLFSENKEAQQAIKTCVYHIILKAIAISKDPRADKRTAMSLYELAKEIIINSQLDSDEATQNRLQDLINAIIDGDDLSAQLRLYNISNRQWLDSKTVLLEEKLNVVAQNQTDIQASLTRMDSKLINTSIRRAPSFILMVIAGFLTMLFTITLSVVIISMILTSANKDTFSLEERNRLQQQQLQQQKLLLEPNTTVEGKH
jgi:hypothetical protein